MRPRRDNDKLAELSNMVEFISAFVKPLDSDVAASALMIVLARVVNTVPTFEWPAFEFHMKNLIKKGEENDEQL